MNSFYRACEPLLLSHAFTPEELAKLMHSTGRLKSIGVVPDDDWLAAAFSALQHQFASGAFDEQSLGIIMLGMSRLQINPNRYHPNWVLYFLLDTERLLHAHEISAFNLHNIIYCLGILRINPSNFHATWLDTYFAASYRKLLDKEYTIKGLSNTMLGLGFLRINPRDHLM
jgi:hypothetical protein